jgi:hypothetical protein
LWDFPNDDAQGYARLIFDQAEGGIDEETDEEKRKWSVTLPWYACSAVSNAIQDWLTFLESGIEEHREPALHLEIESLTFEFYRQTGGQGPRMDCCLETDCGLSRQVILTRSEANLLGRLLFCQGDEEIDRER